VRTAARLSCWRENICSRNNSVQKLIIYGHGADERQNPGKIRASIGHFRRGFWPRGIVRARLYARVSTHDSRLPLQLLRCAIYVVKRGWKTALEIQDVGSGASPKGVKRSRRRGGGVRSDCRVAARPLGRLAPRSRLYLQELASLNVSLSEALDLSTPGGRALAGMLAAFADDAERDILRDRVRAC
jgi:hypothetical protein